MHFGGLSTIQSRLIVMVVATVAPLFALLIWDSLGQRKAALDAAVIKVEAYARLTAIRQERIFAEADALLKTLQVLPEVSARPGADCRATVAAIAEQHAAFRTIGVVSASGTLVCHNIINHTQAFGDQELLHVALMADERQFLVGRLIIGKVTGKPTIITARPLAREGRTEGIVFASLDLPGFSSHVARPSDDLQASVMVVDARDGVVIDASSPDAADLIGRNLEPPPLLRRIRAAQLTGTMEIPQADGSTEIAAYATLHRSALSHLVTVVTTDRALALAQADAQILRRFLFALAATGLAALLASYVGFVAFVAPMRRLDRAARGIGGGDLSIRTSMEPWQAREIRSLADTLNFSAETLALSSSKLTALANEDGLTRLANRRRFDEALETALIRPKDDVSLLLIDVDHFKSFNDAYGHQAGDDCLRKVAECLTACASRPGDVAARYGGEEFALVLTETSEAGAAAVAERIIAAVEALGLEHREAPRGVLTISVGGATVTAGSALATPPAALIARADGALYAAKSGGRGIYMAAARPNRLRLVEG